jgi:pimeloyl-ACP methyl ester carboxylesterase
MTYALLPGAGGAARWYWRRVMPLLEAAGQHVVAVELPAADDSAGLAEYADVAVAALADVPAPLIVVAQSMGSFTAPMVAVRLAAQRIVLVNPMVPAPGEPPGQWWEATGQPAARAEYLERIGLGRSEFDPVEDFFHDVPDDVREAALAEPEPPQSDTPFRQPWPLTAWPDIPTTVIQSADDRLFPVEFQRRVVRERLGLEVEVVPGGHLNALSRPDELAQRLLSYRS